jgi:hypothetical protein
MVDVFSTIDFIHSYKRISFLWFRSLAAPVHFKLSFTTPNATSENRMRGWGEHGRTLSVIIRLCQLLADPLPTTVPLQWFC